jgi:hypothetical protein
MKSEILQDAIGEIKDEYIADAHAVGIKTATSSMKKQFNWNFLGAMAACLCLVVIAGIAVHNTRTEEVTPEIIGNSVTLIAEDDRDLELTSEENETAKEAGTAQEKPIQETADCELTGTDYAFKDTDGYLFLTENLGNIEKDTGWNSELTEKPRVSENGYSHLYIGDDGNELAVNVRDYLIYSGETLACIATVTNDEKGMSYRLEYGSDWIEGYGDILEDYAGRELVYVYAQGAEVILTPDSKVLSPQGNSVPQIFETQNVAEYYDYYKYPQNTLKVSYVEISIGKLK